MHTCKLLMHTCYMNMYAHPYIIYVRTYDIHTYSHTHTCLHNSCTHTTVQVNIRVTYTHTRIHVTYMQTKHIYHANTHTSIHTYVHTYMEMYSCTQHVNIHASIDILQACISICMPRYCCMHTWRETCTSRSWTSQSLYYAQRLPPLLRFIAHNFFSIVCLLRRLRSAGVWRKGCPLYFWIPCCLLA